MWGGSNLPNNPFSSSTGSFDPNSSVPTMMHQPNQKLNTEQIQWLHSQITPQERLELETMTRQYFDSLTMTRGLPVGIASIGGLLWLKQKGIVDKWNPITRLAVFGITPVVSALIGNMIFFQSHPGYAGIQNHVSQLYTKHISQAQSGTRSGTPAAATGGHGHITYAQLREANRAGRPIKTFSEGSTPRADYDTPSAGIKRDPTTDEPLSSILSGSSYAPAKEPQYYMSGTPAPSKQSASISNEITDSFTNNPASSDFGLEMIPGISPINTEDADDNYSQDGGQRREEKKPRGREKLYTF